MIRLTVDALPKTIEEAKKILIENNEPVSVVFIQDMFRGITHRTAGDCGYVLDEETQTYYKKMSCYAHR
jgi:hypothetical protein